MQSSGPASGAAAVLVAVLAGGEGRRLGGAKAAMEVAGRPLISYPLAAARAAGLEAVVVAKRRTPLPALEEVVVHEADAPSHPLCGVLAALAFAGRRSRNGRGRFAAVVTIACDMPFLTAPLLAWLARLEGPAIVHGAGRPQPLIARHTPAGAAILARALQERRSLTDGCLLAGCRVVGEQELSRHGDPGRLCFSVNSPADVALAESWLAGSPVSAPGG